jgi:hypothetical protein
MASFSITCLSKLIAERMLIMMMIILIYISVTQAYYLLGCTAVLSGIYSLHLPGWRINNQISKQWHRSFEALVNNYRTARWHIAEENTWGTWNPTSVTLLCLFKCFEDYSIGESDVSTLYGLNRCKDIAHTFSYALDLGALPLQAIEMKPKSVKALSKKLTYRFRAAGGSTFIILKLLYLGKRSQ